MYNPNDFFRLNKVTHILFCPKGRLVTAKTVLSHEAWQIIVHYVFKNIVKLKQRLHFFSLWRFL